MAILTTCWKCNSEFCTSASNYGGLCNECDGTNKTKREEEERWCTLTIDPKGDELRLVVLSVKDRGLWDG